MSAMTLVKRPAEMDTLKSEAPLPRSGATIESESASTLLFPPVAEAPCPAGEPAALPPVVPAVPVVLHEVVPAAVPALRSTSQRHGCD